MNQEQKDRIEKIILKDAEIRFEYCDAVGRTCVLGGLLTAAGVPKTVFSRLDTVAIDPKYVNDITKRTENLRLEMIEVLITKYGLRLKDAEHLQFVNDCCEDRETRQKCLLEVLDEIPVTEN